MLTRLALFALVLACSTPEPARALSPLPPQTEVAVGAVDALPSPITLSDPDGQDLTLADVQARVAVTGPLALTELELRFQNPQDRRIEGRFNLTLPEGATISRFAKEVNGQLVEGEVVERVAAHRVYDQILHQMRDPALLEQDAGNTFSAKVFPIEPKATVRIVLSYSQVLRREDGARTWNLPLRGLPTVGHFELHGRFVGFSGETTADLPAAERSADGVQHLDIVKDAWTPDRDVSIRWKSASEGQSQLLQASDFYVASYQPELPAQRAVGLSKWSFYVDTSASAADGRDHRIEAFTALLRSLPSTATVEVRAFDQDVALLASGPANDVAKSIGDKLRARGFAGGTDLGKVLDDVRTRARKDTRVVLATDGMATLGDTNVAHLGELAAIDGVQLHALVLGSEQDSATLNALTAGHGRVVTLPFSTSWQDEATRAANWLALPPGATFTGADANAQWTHTVGGGDVRPGGEVLVMGKVQTGKSPAPVLTGNGRTLSAGPTFAVRDAAPLVEREAVRAHLDALALQEAAAPSAEAAQALAEEQVRLSVTHRVLCAKTTLLVLESEEDYARFGLDRRALADILTVGPQGITTVTRPAWKAPEPRPEPVATKAPADKTEAKKQKGGFANKKEADAVLADDGSFDEEKSDEAAGPGGGDLDSMASADAAPSAGAAAPPPAPMAEAPVEVAARASSPAEAERRADRPRPSRDREQSVAESVESRPSPITVVNAAPARPDWTLPTEFPSAKMEELEAAIAANPRDREAYNQLAAALYATQRWERLGEVAEAWQPYDPANPQVYEMMGEAALARGDAPKARRAFGSLTELAGGKPELLQRAGLLLWRAGDPAAGEAPLRKALEARPDRVNSWRHLALLLRVLGRYDEAEELLQKALETSFPDYYRDVHRVVREELATVIKEDMAAHPERVEALRARAKTLGLDLTRTDALRVTLAWETDGNDVDLHVVDPNNEECFYSHKQNASGLELYEDLTGGLGPEVIRAAKLPHGRYYIGVKYFSAGPMGVSRGLVIVEEANRTPRVLPFRLVQGGKDLRLVETIDL